MAERQTKRPRFSLVARMYAAGLLLVVSSALVAWGIGHVLMHESMPPERAGRMARFVGMSAASDPNPQAGVERVHAELGADVAIFAADGTPIARTAHAPRLPTIPPSTSESATWRPGGGWAFALDDGRVVVVRMNWRPPPRTPLPLIAGVLGVLVVIGLAAWLVSRWLTRPLTRLGATARAIAAGELASRTGIVSDDELGDAGIAFDRMAERVESLLRSQNELLAGVSHELRTPLARIRVALDLANEAPDPNTVRTELAGLEQDLGELELLVSDLLATARLGTQPSKAGAPNTEMPLRRESTSLAEVTERARARFTERHPKRVVALTVDERKTAQLDPRLLRRAIENVLDNAHKYSDPDAPIRIDVRADGERTLLEIRDEGIGIAPEDCAQVFSPFFRADRAEVRASSGLGLGLALSKRIVDAHGGSIALESTLGEGTTVRIRV
jgi:signal transduction histidine kinase